MKSALITFAYFVLVFSAVNSMAENLDTRLLQSLGEVKYHELKSTGLKRSFHIFVDLPEDYLESDQSYPVIYLLDGGNTFPLMAAYHHYLRFGDETPKAILVGVSYGADTFKEGNWRSTDYTAPSDEREFWGGAAIFQKVLQDELLPLIEAAYRADPARRVIFGHSLGGQFVLFNALTKPELFSGHIASNPALHRNLPFFLKWQGKNDMPVKISKVFVSSGEFDDPIFRKPTMEWIEYWQAVTPRPWVLETRTLSGQTHLSATPEAFRQGLSWLFPEHDDP
ncbi:MAG: alpha/beta hydrolase-fold protein [Xanthomonadales bacterium]|nr:alpha/beta hydrolase-fold protein [Xanthomonadales bacterium]